MKGKLTLLAVCLAGGLSLSSVSSTPMPKATSAGVETFAVDPTHSTVLFRIKHLGVSYAYGRFNTMEGKFLFDEADPTASSIELTIDAASVDTASEDRDRHLRSPDFFSAKEFPKITFASTKVKHVEGKRYAITGELELHGVARTIEVEAEYVGAGEDPWGGHRAGFEAVFTVDPRDFEFGWMIEHEGALGPDVRMTVSLEGVRESS